MRIIMHIDVNNAFLSWTALELLEKGYKYDIRNSYAVVGGDETKRTGIVLAKSTPAKKLGIRTGETLYSARKKCRVLKTYYPNYNYYKIKSKQLFDLLYKYTPDLEIASVDECYIDYTKVKNIYGDELEFAKKIQKEIKEKLKFTVNIGIANNKLCAKMASDFTKPNKIHTLYDYEVKEKMWNLDVGELFGIGKKNTEKLKKLNINTIKDLAETQVSTLYPYFKNQSKLMIDWANGIDNSEVHTEPREPKGIGNEITLSHDVKDKTELYNSLLYLSEIVGSRLRKNKKYTSTIVVILKDKYFKRKNHQKKILNPTNEDKEIYKYAKEIFNEMYDNEEIRLIGIRLEKLTDKKISQISLFDNLENKNEDLDEVIDNLKIKYGTNIVKKASLINRKEKKGLKT